MSITYCTDLHTYSVVHSVPSFAHVSVQRSAQHKVVDFLFLNVFLDTLNLLSDCDFCPVYFIYFNSSLIRFILLLLFCVLCFYCNTNKGIDRFEIS